MEEYYYDYNRIESLLPYQASSDLVGHGDWVLKAFCDQLADPSRTEILAIDMDFTTFEDFNYLFEDDPSQNGIQNYFNAVVDEFWNTLDHEAYHYVVSGLSVSLTSQSNQFEAAIADLIDYDWIFTQSAANTNSPGNAFGDTLPNVITVGAYNTDSSGYWLGSNYDDYLEIDLYADGYVENLQMG